MASTPSPERGRLEIPSWLLPVVLVSAAVLGGIYLLLSNPPQALVTSPPSHNVAASLPPTATMPPIPTATPPSVAPSTPPVASGGTVTTTTLLLTWEPGKEAFKGSCATPLRTVGRSSQAPQFVQLDCDLDQRGDAWSTADQVGISNDALLALPDCCRPAPTAAPAPSTANYASSGGQGAAPQAPVVYTDLNTLPTAPPEATAPPAAPADSTEGCSLTTSGGRCPAQPIPTRLPADQARDGVTFHWPPLPANGDGDQAQP